LRSILVFLVLSLGLGGGAAQAGDADRGAREPGIAAPASLTLIPGQDMAGDGLVLTVHGFIVEMLTPEGRLPVQRW